MPRQQCIARAKSTGNKCTRPTIAGGTVCRLHGGAAPQVKEAARIRLLSLVDPALGVLARAVRKRKSAKWEPSATEIAAAREILARAGIGEADPTSPGIHIGPRIEVMLVAASDGREVMRPSQSQDQIEAADDPLSGHEDLA